MGAIAQFIVIGTLARYVGMKTGACGANFGVAIHVDLLANSWQHADLDLGT